MDESKEKNKESLKKKRKNGIWFSDSTSLDLYAQEKAAKLEKLFEDIIFYTLTISIQLIQTAGVVAIAYFNNAFPELAFFLIGFFFTRSFLGKTFHLSSTVMCTTFTWTSFFLVTLFVPSIYISVFLCILLGAGMSIYMHYLVVKGEEKCQKD